MSDYTHLQEGLIPIKIKAEYSNETMNESKKTPNQICAAKFIKFSLLLLTLSGLVGVIVQLSYLNTGSPRHQYNAPYVSGVWLSFFIFFYSLCGYLKVICEPYSAIRKSFFFIRVFFSSCGRLLSVEVPLALRCCLMYGV